MKKNYQAPESEVLALNMELPFLSVSAESGQVGHLEVGLSHQAMGGESAL